MQKSYICKTEVLAQVFRIEGQSIVLVPERIVIEKVILIGLVVRVFRIIVGVDMGTAIKNRLGLVVQFDADRTFSQ